MRRYYAALIDSHSWCSQSKVRQVRRSGPCRLPPNWRSGPHSHPEIHSAQFLAIKHRPYTWHVYVGSSHPQRGRRRDQTGPVRRIFSRASQIDWQVAIKKLSDVTENHHIMIQVRIPSKNACFAPHAELNQARLGLSASAPQLAHTCLITCARVYVLWVGSACVALASSVGKVTLVQCHVSCRLSHGRCQRLPHSPCAMVCGARSVPRGTLLG